MNLLDLLAKLKTLTEAIKAGNLVAVLDVVGDLLKLAATLAGGFGATEAHDSDVAVFAGCDTAIANLEGLCGVGAGPADDGAKAIDPATILTIISLVKLAVEFIRKRRQG